MLFMSAVFLQRFASQKNFKHLLVNLMMSLKLYNTLTRKKEIFKPIHKNFVGIYSCGPTVYSYQHIGNMRSYIFSDLLRRILEYNNCNVKQIINVTDVGHLTSDADEGEDKMER